MNMENVRWVKSWRNLGSQSRFATVRAGVQCLPNFSCLQDSEVLIRGYYVCMYDVYTTNSDAYDNVPKLKGDSFDSRAIFASR